MSVTALISNISRASIHDGPGLRTVVFFKGCSLRCRWCHNPEAQRPGPQVMVLQSRCIRCGACSACPSGARGTHGEVDSVRCTGCGMCVSVCPTKACRVSGTEMTPEDVLARVLPDRPFFRRHGGVTFSGGEPMDQPEFAFALAVLLRKEGVGTAMETCGFAPSEAFRNILPYIDLFLYDWKITDPALHREWTGKDNQLILENLRMLHDSGAEIILRCPVIPGVNDTPEHFSGIADLAGELPRIRRIDLLPYHALGNNKRAQLGLPDDGFRAPGEETVQRWLEELRAHCRMPVSR